MSPPVMLKFQRSPGIDTYRSDRVTLQNWDVRTRTAFFNTPKELTEIQVTCGDDCLAIKGVRPDIPKLVFQHSIFSHLITMKHSIAMHIDNSASEHDEHRRKEHCLSWRERYRLRLAGAIRKRRLGECRRKPCFSHLPFPVSRQRPPTRTCPPHQTLQTNLLTPTPALALNPLYVLAMSTRNVRTTPWRTSCWRTCVYVR